MILELPILWHSDETYQLDDMGMDFDVDDLEERMATFYRIDAISPNRGYGREYCNIHASGEKWVCPRPYETIKKIIDQKTSEYE